MQVKDILAPISSDMDAVNRVISERLSSDVVLINQLSQYIIHSGGKRLRPAIVLLCARACGEPAPQHQLVAAIVEFIHTATLLHDDVVDGSDLRRGRETANAVWGNEASVLTGDFLYSRAFQMMVDADDMRIMKIMADTTNSIAEGEVLQLINSHDPDLTEQQYLDVISRKTAILFEAGARCGALVAGASGSECEAMASYGLHLGNAFQLIDDVLDYTADAAEMGKNVGDDLAEGKVTLPLIHAMQHGKADEKTLIRNAISDADISALEQIRTTIESTGAIDYTAALAAAEAARAKDSLASIPDSEFKQALTQLADFSVNRKH